jgi:uncharacterized delta-60 repeat protein
MRFFSKRQGSHPTLLIRRVPPRIQPRLEALEDRCLLSAGMPGTLDTTFGNGAGYVSTNPGGATSPSIALQADGKIVGAGAVAVTVHGKSEESMAVFRYNSDGSVDTTFGSGGLVTTTLGKYGTWGNAVAIDAQGRILVAGMEQESALPGKLGYNVAGVIARYNSNGSLDKTFGSNGIIITDFVGGNIVPTSIAIQAWDGEIVVAGSSGQTNGSRLSVARYNTDGLPDTTFGSGGLFVLNGPNTAPSHAQHFTFQADHQIVLAGGVGYPSSVQYGEDAFLLVRLNDSNGTLDTTFNGTGYVVSPLPSLYPNDPSMVNNGGDANGVVIQSDGSIVAVGSALGHTLNVDSAHTVGMAVARYTTSGALDSSFGSNGYATFTQLYGGNAIAIQPDTNGELDITGYVPAGSSSNAAIARLLPTGALDPNFGTNGGYSTLPIDGTSYGSLVIQSDGKIVVAGNPAVARYYGASPQIGSFTASPNPVTAGSSVTLTASNITDGNPNVSITQVAIYLDSNHDGTLEPGTDQLLGYATQTSPGVWTLTNSSAFGLTAGTYKLFAQAEDSDGVYSDPVALTLTVQ